MSKNTILIVDDEKEIIDLLEHSFSRAEYDVKSAANGEQALKIIEKENIHVIFTDLNMPEMDGIQLCRKIKKSMPMTMVFAITGYASFFELADCREAGFDDYFKKPVDLKILKKTAEDAFEKLKRWKTN